MNFQLVLIWSFVIVVTAEGFTADILEKLPEGILSRIRLRTNVTSTETEYENWKSHELKKLKDAEDSVKWFQKIDGSLIDGKFVSSTLHGIETQRAELEMISQMLKESKSLLELEKNAAEIMKRYANKMEVPDEFEIKEIKKWLLACKLKESECRALDGIKTLITDKSNPILRLLKDANLLVRLSHQVKVTTWPSRLTLAHFITSENNFSVHDAKLAILNLLNQVKLELDHHESTEASNFAEEVNLRSKLVEQFTNTEGNAILTPVELRRRLEAFELIFNNFLRANQESKGPPLGAKEVELAKLWLLVHQTIYQVDGLSECGGFTRNWSIPFPLTNYPIDKKNDDATAYDYLNRTVTPTQPDANEQPKLLFPRLVEERYKLFAFARRKIGELASSAKSSIQSAKSSISSMFAGGNKLKGNDGAGVTENVSPSPSPSSSSSSSPSATPTPQKSGWFWW